jgi:hypothetical protein
MADEKQDQQKPEWLGKPAEPDSMRNYRPVDAPEEPNRPPPGRASASAPGGDVPQGEGQGTIGDTRHGDDLSSGDT